MKNQALTTTNLADFSVTIAPDALQCKADALSLAKSITSVASADEQQDAIAAGGLLKGLIRGMENTRKEVKAPVLEASAKIDSTAKQYSAELAAELARVEKLAADFQCEEDCKTAAIRAEEERRQQEEREAEERERRKEQEALARIAAEAERERRAALARIQAAEDETAREIAQKEADRLAEARAEEIRNNQIACQEAEDRRQEAMRQRHETMLATAPAKPQGATVRRTLNYELKDIRALYAARPDLVELTERRAQILAAIAIPGAPSIPGIYVFEQTKMNTKAS